MYDPFIIQAVLGNTTVTTPTTSESLSTLVSSIALLIGAVVPIIISVLSFVKVQSHDPKIKDAMNTAISVGKLTTTISNKALENKESLKSAIEWGLSVTPEDSKNAILKKQELIDKLTAQIEATRAQLNRLTPDIPGKANADTIKDLPREDTITKST
jgi:hypothetical protein